MSMKHWKISYTVKTVNGQEDKDLIVEATTIDEALAKGHKAVAIKELPEAKTGDMLVIWDVGIMEDDVF